MGTCPASLSYSSAASKNALAIWCFATVPIGALLSVSEETALHPLWRAQNAILSSKPSRSGSSRPASKSRRVFSLTGGVAESARVERRGGPFARSRL
jgi:hypothetical protein